MHVGREFSIVKLPTQNAHKLLFFLWEWPIILILYYVEEVMGYKTTDGLMRHLRDNGIAISGSAQKRLLINTGYFHGYKGYRFFKTASRKIPFTT